MPIKSTVNGKAAISTQDSDSYERVAKLAAYTESLQAIRQALTEKGRPLDSFLQEFETALSIQP